jgi:hypothetical protein
MQSRQDLIQLELTEDEAQEIINSLPENNWAGKSVKTKVKSLLEKKKQRDSHPHKLADEYEAMQNCPYRGDWHYCCRCEFDLICTGSDHYNKNMVKKHIEENRGK